MIHNKDKKIKMNVLPFALAAGVVFATLTASGCSKKAVSKESSQAVQETQTQPESSQAAVEETTASNPHTMPELKSEETVGIMSGVVKDATMNTLTISNGKYPDGVVFSKEEAGVSLAEGLLVDHQVTVLFRGEIEKDEEAGLMAELVRDTREDDESCEAGVISGEVVSVGMSVITIRTADGTEVSFEQDPKPVNLTAGPLEGDKISIFYSFKKGESIYVPELIVGESE